MSGRAKVAGLGILLAALLLPSPALAQFGPLGGPGRRWSPAVGVRAGWAWKDDAPSLGGVVIVPVPLFPKRPTLTAGGDFLFQNGLTEKEGTLDVTIDLTPGLFFGGSAAMMNTIFPGETLRATRSGYGIVGGLRGRAGPLNTMIEARKLWIDNRKPSLIMLTFAYPLLSAF